MANLLDYLDWRGDVPFSADPFNYVDGLILAELSYVDFSGIVPGPQTVETIDSKTVCEGRGGGSAEAQRVASSEKQKGNDKGLRDDPEKHAGISVQEAAQRFWELHSEQEIENSSTLFKRAPFLLKKLCSGERFAAMVLAGYVDQISAEKNEQMSAITYYLGDGTAFAAFRGTDDTIVGWKEDFCFSFQKETAGQKSAAEYLSRMFGDRGKFGDEKDENSRMLRVGGHSKGGNFAVFASAFCDKNVRSRIRDVYTYDGPGLLEEVTHTEEYREILPRVHSVIPEESLFGLLLDSGYYHKIVKSSAKGIWQHDPLSWDVMRNRFIEVERIAEGSQILSGAVEKWIRGMSLEERRDVVDALFSLIEDTGYETLSGITSSQFRSIPELIRAYYDMDSEGKNTLRNMVGSLLKSSADIVSEELRDKASKHLEKTGYLIGP